MFNGRLAAEQKQLVCPVALPAGVQYILNNWAANATAPGMAPYTWRVLMYSVVEYCRRYAALEQADAAAGGAAAVAGAAKERIMNRSDAKALCAYLRLFRCAAAARCFVFVALFALYVIGERAES